MENENTVSVVERVQDVDPSQQAETQMVVLEASEDDTAALESGLSQVT